MPYPVYRVVSFGRRTRRTLDVLAIGLTHDAARALATRLRLDHADREHIVGFQIETMPLADQVQHLAAGETMAALRHAA